MQVSTNIGQSPAARAMHGGVVDQVSRRRIKVMLAIDGLGLGGAEMVVRDLARFLDRDWFDVCVCCTRGLGGSIGEELLRDGFDVFVLPGQQTDGGLPDGTEVSPGRQGQERRYRTHARDAALLDASPCRLTMPGLKVVHTFHFGNYPHDSWRYHVMEGLRSRRRQADRGGLGATAADTGRLPVARVTDGHDLEWRSQPPPPLSNGSFATEVGTGDRLLIGTIAKLIEQKGLDDLLTVAQRCRDAATECSS